MTDKTEWVMAPLAATDEMLDAWKRELVVPSGASAEARARRAYRAMLAAAPTPPAQEAQPVAWRDPYNSEPGQSVTFQLAAHLKWPHIFKQPLYTLPPDAARRIAELEAQVENQIESVRFHRQRVDDLAAAYSKLEAERDRWIALYRRAVNEANGLTNYVEDRPELRSAEKKLTVIEAEARAALVREP